MKVIPLSSIRVSKGGFWEQLIHSLRTCGGKESRKYYDWCQAERKHAVRNVEDIELHATKQYLVVTDKAVYLSTGEELSEEIMKREVKEMRAILKTRKLQEEYVRLKAFLNGETQASTTGRAREPIPDDVRIFVWRRDDGRCVKCGSQDKLEYDHIIPWSKGGSNT